MSLTTDQKASRSFKREMGVGESNVSRDFFEESFASRPSIYTDDIWSESSDIPTTAPSLPDLGISGVVQYLEKVTLTAVPGTSNSFQSDDLIDAIPFNFGDGSYNYSIYDSTDTIIPFGDGDWVVDPGSGILTFYGTVPSNMPPKVSFYKYVGLKGIGGSTSGSETVTRTIYVNADTGDDTTGDGTSGTPYETLDKALSTLKPVFDNCVITILLEAATATYTLDTEYEFHQEGLAYLKIQGEMTQVATGLSLTEDVAEPGKYDEASLTFTPDAYKDMTIGYSIFYLPIAKNDAGSIYTIPGFSLSNTVYEHGTIISQASLPIICTGKSLLQHWNIKFETTGTAVNPSYDRRTDYVWYSCLLNGDKTNRLLTLGKLSSLIFYYCNLQSTASGGTNYIGKIYENIAISNCLISSSDQSTLGLILYGPYKTSLSNNIIFRNFETALEFVYGSYNFSNVRLIDCDYGANFVNSLSGLGFEGSSIVLDNVDRLLSFEAAEPFGIYGRVSEVIGTLGTGLTDDEEFKWYNKQNSVNFQLPGIYAAEENDTKITLPDNTTNGKISIGDIDQNERIIFRMKCVRGSSPSVERIEDLDIIITQSGVNWDGGSGYGDDVGLTINNITLDGTTIEIDYTTTSTGDDIDITYDAKRFMKPINNL